MTEQPHEPRILVVEDDAKLAALVQEFLRNNQLQVELEFRGDTGLEHILNAAPDLVVLDLMLPGLSGFDVCRGAREKNYKGPILILTARDEELDEILGLELGADDYMTKPVKPRVLLARIHNLLRRFAIENQPEQAGETSASQRIELGPILVDASQRTASVHAVPVDLTTAEFDLLWFLAEHVGQVLSRDDIYLALRGIPFNGTDRSIDLRIARLRQKLSDNPHAPSLIKSVRGVGYMLMRPA